MAEISSGANMAHVMFLSSVGFSAGASGIVYNIVLGACLFIGI